MEIKVGDPTLGLSEKERKKLSRREVMVGGVSLGFATAALAREAKAKISRFAKGSGAAPPAPPSGPERLWRSAQGISPIPADLSFMWINMLSVYSGGPADYTNKTDARGWLNSGGANPPSAFGGAGASYFQPVAANYSGPDTTQKYFVVGEGEGDINLQAVGAGWVATPDTGASYGAVQTGALSWRVTETAPYVGNSARNVNPPWKIVFSRTDQYYRPSTYYGSFAKFTNSNFNNNGRYLKNVAMMRSIDHADWVAGQYFRTAFKDMVIAMNPSYIRYQAWNGVLDLTCADYRFRDRPLPDNAGGVWGMNVQGCLNYTASGTLTVTPADVCKYNMTGIAGTPANMKHGEIAMFLCATDWSLSSGTHPDASGVADGSGKFVAGVTNGATTYIATTSAHNMHVGDKLMLEGNYFTYKDMNKRLLTVLSVFSATVLEVNFNSTGFGTWNPGYDSGGICPMVYLQVGSGGDRAGSTGYGYPVLTSNGTSPITYQATAGYSSAGGMGSAGFHNCFYFNKEVIGTIDLDGTIRWGAWLTTSLPGAPTTRQGIVPLEMQTQLINELEARIIATGQAATKGPINPWICIPVNGMVSIDADYDAADNYGVGMVNHFLNGTGSFPGIPSRCILFIEYTNEAFNTGGGTAVSQAAYNVYMGCHRWTTWTPGGGGETWVPGDPASWVNGAMLRWYANVWDIKQAFAAESASKKIRFAIALWPFGLTGPQGSGVPGWPVYAGGDFCLFADTTYNKYFTNGSGNIPPGTPSTFYKFPTSAGNYPIHQLDYISPGTYTTTDYFTAWFADVTKWDNALASWVSHGGKKALTGYTPNMTTYETALTTAGAHTFDVGDIVMNVNIVVTGGEKSILNVFPAAVTASNKAAGTLSIGLQSGYNAGAFVSGDILTLIKGAQDTDMNTFMAWMVAPGSYPSPPFAGGAPPYAIDYFIGAMKQMIGIAQLYHPPIKCNSYEGYIQMPVNPYKFPGSVHGVTLASPQGGLTPGTYTNVNIYTTYGGKFASPTPTLGDAGFNGAAYAKCTVVVDGGGTVSSVTVTSGGRGYTPSEAGPPPRNTYYWLQAPFGDTLVMMPYEMVHVPGVTCDETLGFLMSCFYCTALANYVDDFFGATRTDTRLEGIANLTFLYYVGSQWGIQFNDPWAFGPSRGADWATPNATMQAVGALNALP